MAEKALSNILYGLTSFAIFAASPGVIDVDLQCERCYKKIQKAIRKLQEQEDIKSVSYDTKNNKVTISGPFDDPDKLSQKLRCKACKVIRGIKILQPPRPSSTHKSVSSENKSESDEKQQPDTDKTKPDEVKKPNDDKKLPDGKKPQESKPKHTEPAAAATSTMVNVQFTPVCSICYPWPCGDPSHWPAACPQQWHYEGVPLPVPAVPSDYQHCDWGAAVAPPRWSCSGPSHCGGCRSCGGGGGGAFGWPAAAMCCCYLEPQWGKTQDHKSRASSNSEK